MRALCTDLLASRRACASRAPAQKERQRRPPKSITISHLQARTKQTRRSSAAKRCSIRARTQVDCNEGTTRSCDARATHCLVAQVPYPHAPTVSRRLHTLRSLPGSHAHAHLLAQRPAPSLSDSKGQGFYRAEKGFCLLTKHFLK